jgi:hypothetical protein
MAYFAQLNQNNVVLQVIAISNNDAPDPYPASEALGQAFIASLGLEGVWKQTSYHGTFRTHYAGIGYTYDDQADVFIPPQPYPSWTLDDQWNWQPPTPYPTDGGMYQWDENTQTWVAVTQ